MSRFSVDPERLSDEAQNLYLNAKFSDVEYAYKILMTLRRAQLQRMANLAHENLEGIKREVIVDVDAWMIAVYYNELPNKPCSFYGLDVYLTDNAHIDEQKLVYDIVQHSQLFLQK